MNGEQKLFREKFWTDHDLLRDDCIIPGSPVGKLLLQCLLTRIGMDRSYWDAPIGTLRRWCNGAHERTVRDAMNRLQRHNLATFESIRRAEPGWYRCRVLRMQLAEFRADPKAKESPTPAEGIANADGRILRSTPKVSPAPTAGIANDTSYQQKKKQKPPPFPTAGVEEVLQGIGLKNIAGPLRRARARGETDVQIFEAIDEFERGPYDGPGALHFRLENGTWPDAAKSTATVDLETKRQYVASLSDDELRDLLSGDATGLQLLEELGRENDTVVRRVYASHKQREARCTANS